MLLDVNETLPGLSPLRSRCTGLGAPLHLFETWFAGTLRDEFALVGFKTYR